MAQYYWNDWYSGWGWILWFGMIFLFVSMAGNWGYTYQAHRRYGDMAQSKDALELLAERYAKGEIKEEEFLKMREQISSALEMRPGVRESKSPNGSDPTSTKLFFS